MPLISNTVSRQQGSGIAGAQAGRTRVQAEKEKRREGFLKSYIDQKQQIAATLTNMRKAIGDKYLADQKKIKSFKFAEGEDRRSEMMNALDARKRNDLMEFEDFKQRQIKSFSDSVHAPLMAMGIIPMNQAGIDRQAFNQIGRGLDPEEQAFIDALPEEAKAKAKERGRPSDKLSRLQDRREALTQELNGASSSQRKAITKKISEIEAAIRSSITTGTTAVSQVPSPTVSELGMTRRFVSQVWPGDLPPLEDAEQERFNDIVANTAKEYARKNKTDLNTGLNAVWPDIFESVVNKGQVETFLGIDLLNSDIPSKLKSIEATDGPATPKTKADLDKLPSGAEYINPADGKVYRKK